jgi:hypothetical protein
MYQVPMNVWNEIAESQPLGQPWADLFRLTPEALPAALEKAVDVPAAQAGLDNRTILALRLVAPLLMETEAISAYLTETGQPTLRASMPEINSVNEALILASTEYRLSPSQQAKLKAQLLAVMRRSSAKQNSAQPTAQR